MVCKFNNVQGGVSNRIVQHWLMIIYVYIDSFGVLESNGIHPQLLLNKHVMFSRNNEARWWGQD